MRRLRSNSLNTLMILSLFLTGSPHSALADGVVGSNTGGAAGDWFPSGNGGANGKAAPTTPISQSRAVAPSVSSTASANGALQNLANNPSNVGAISSANGALNSMGLAHMALLKDVASGNFNNARLPELAAAINSSAGTISLPPGADGKAPSESLPYTLMRAPASSTGATSNVGVPDGIPGAVAKTAGSPLGSQSGLTRDSINNSFAVPAALSNDKAANVAAQTGTPDPEMPGVSYTLTVPGAPLAVQAAAANKNAIGPTTAENILPNAKAAHIEDPKAAGMSLSGFFAAIKTTTTPEKKKDSEEKPEATAPTNNGLLLVGGMLPGSEEGDDADAARLRAKLKSSQEEANGSGPSLREDGGARSTASSSPFGYLIQRVQETADHQSSMFIFLATSVAAIFLVMELMKLRLRKTEAKWVEFEAEYKRLFENHSPLIMPVSPESVTPAVLESRKGDKPMNLEKSSPGQFVIWVDAQTKQWVLGKQIGNGSDIKVMGILKSGSRIKTNRIKDRDRTGIVELKADGSFMHVDQEKEAYLYSAKNSA